MRRADESANNRTGQLHTGLRALAVAGGAGLVGSYVVPWVRVTGETSRGASGTISAGELELLPEVAVALGVVAAVLAATRWTTPVQVGVLAAGLVTTGIALFARSFPGSDADIIRLGGYAGPPGAFEPAPGTTLALAASLVLVGCGFGALMNRLRSRG